jgi:hypothetical protein
METFHATKSIFTNYGISEWQIIFEVYFMPVLMLSSLVAWILSGRCWNVYAYWVIAAIGMMHYPVDVIEHGWKTLLPMNPYPEAKDQMWGYYFVASWFGWMVVILSLSSPLWRKWLRRKLGLMNP